MQPVNFIKLILGTCLTTYLSPEALSIVSLLSALPYAQAQLKEDSWVSLSGNDGEKYFFNAITSYENTSFASGIQNRGHPNYDAIVATMNNNGELTSNLQIELGTSSSLTSNTFYNDAIYSSGYFVDNQDIGLLCKTRLNGTLDQCFKISGLTGDSRLTKIDVTPNNNLLIPLNNGMLVEMHSNTTLKFANKYSYSSEIEFLSSRAISDHEYISVGRSLSSPFKGIILKTTNYGKIIWALELTDKNGANTALSFVNLKGNNLIISGSSDNSGIILEVDATTGELSNTKTIGGGGFTYLTENTILNDDTILTVGFSNKNSLGSQDAIGVLTSDNSTSILKIAGTKQDLFRAVSQDKYGNTFLAGATASSTDSLNLHRSMLAKLDSNLELNEADLPPGLGFYNSTSDFSINNNASSLAITNITSLITSTDLTSTVNFTDITDQAITSSPMINTWLHAPTGQPSGDPSAEPSSWPSAWPTGMPSGYPTFDPTSDPSGQPSADPSAYPTFDPTAYPTFDPTTYPTGEPSAFPTAGPTGWPSIWPSSMPSGYPTGEPSGNPTGQPTVWPTSYPTDLPTGYPTGEPSSYPSAGPSSWPSAWPTGMPSGYPTFDPTSDPCIFRSIPPCDSVLIRHPIPF